MDSTGDQNGWLAPEAPRPAVGKELYMGLLPRFGALVVDAVVFWLLMIGPYLVLEGIGGESRSGGGSFVLVIIGGAFAYFTLLWAFNNGQTVGMRAAGIQVVCGKDGAPIGLGRAAVRTVGLYVTLTFGLISVLVLLVSKRSLADFLAGTAVVRKAKQVASG